MASPRSSRAKKLKLRERRIAVRQVLVQSAGVEEHLLSLPEVGPRDVGRDIGNGCNLTNILISILTRLTVIENPMCTTCSSMIGYNGFFFIAPPDSQIPEAQMFIPNSDPSGVYLPDVCASDLEALAPSTSAKESFQSDFRTLPAHA